MTAHQLESPRDRVGRQFHTDFTSRIARFVLLTVALGLAAWGAIYAIPRVFAPTLEAAVGETVQAGNLLFSVNEVEWIGVHSMDEEEEQNDVRLAPDINATNMGGFTMPPAMMPGMPRDGQRRLRVDLSLQNAGAGIQEVSPVQFFVEDADGNTWLPLDNSEFRTYGLTANQGIGAILFVDVDEDAARPALIWQRNGARVEIPLFGIPDHNNH